MELSVKDIPAKEWQERTEAARLYLANGNMRIVSEVMDIPYATLCQWKKEGWWHTIVDELKAAKKAKQGRKIDTSLEVGLDLIQDRLENGDFILNNKTGEVQRKPVSLKDVTNTVNSLLARQTQIDELAAKAGHSENTMQDVLATLAKEFQKFNKIQRTKDATTVEFKEL